MNIFKRLLLWIKSWFKSREAFTEEPMTDPVPPAPEPVTPVEPVPAPTPVPTPAPQPAPSYQFYCDFSRPWQDYGFTEHAKVPGRATLVKVGGVSAVRLHTESGDNNVNGSNAAERCDLRLSNAASDAREGREWWFAHSVLFPDDFIDQPESTLSTWNWGSVFNWHDDADDGGSQGPLQLMMMPRTAISPDRPTGLHFQVYGGNSGNSRLGDFPVAPIVRNKWYNFVYHVKWTASAAGFADGWLNGKQFMAHKGPTLHAGNGAYVKLANYHSAHGKPSSVIHARVIRSAEPLPVLDGL